MSGGSVPASAVVRGAFARFDTHQRWAPGSPSALIARDSGWLERWFPLPSGPTYGESGRGALWVRFIDGAWYVCHSSVPEWSASRSIPAWVVSRIEPGVFRGDPILGSEAVAAMAAVASDRAARAWPSGAPGVVPATSGPSRAAPSWLPAVPRFVAMLVDAALQPGNAVPGSFAVPASCLPAGGWVALQAVLGAMVDSGVPEPCAVFMCDPGWAPRPSTRIPPGSYVFLHSVSDVASAQTAVPRSRGVELNRFITDLESARSAVCHAASAVSQGSGGAVSFADAVAGAVPLGLVDAGSVRREEAIDWAAMVDARLGGPDQVRRQVGDLARRVREGEDRVAGPAIALAASWLMRAGIPADARKQLDAWIWPMLGSA